jgi:quercetin dioxygenase-like cupin family protein
MSDTQNTRLPILVKAADLQFVEGEWGQLTWYANDQLGNADTLTLGKCVIYPGQANPRHYHPNCDEILTVLQGKIRHAWIDGQEVEMNPGDTITIPQGMMHQARNIGTEDAVLLIAFTSATRQTIGETP